MSKGQVLAVSPIEGFVRRGLILAGEEGNEVNAVIHPVLCQLPAGRGDCGGEDVERNHRLIVNAAGGERAFPTHEIRNVNAAFKQFALLAAERPIVGGVVGLRRAAVVAEKEHQRVLV